MKKNVYSAPEKMRHYPFKYPFILKPAAGAFMPFHKTGCAILLCAAGMFFNSCNGKTTAGIIATEEDLGRNLFFDPLLSRDSSISCASCHKPEHAFADNVAFSKGVRGQVGERNTPSAMNQGERNFYFWDGRAESLEEQALGPIENRSEMDLPLSLIVRRLNASARYRTAFQNVYGQPPSRNLLATAIAAYERSLETGKSGFDRYMKEDDTSAFSASARRGLQVFNGKGHCFSCHFGVDFAGNDSFKNIGLYNGKGLKDEGRIQISCKQRDLGAFKTPGLRNIAQTAPYMHNGMFSSLRQVIDYYNEPDRVIKDAVNRDTLLQHPLNLSAREKADLENFLRSLSDERFAD